jgi:NitT/TauT family transport system substrate-binding protein
LALAACGGDPGETSENRGAQTGPATTPITVGVIPIVDVAPIYLGVEQGFFADEGLDVTLKPAQGGAAIVPAVISGEYQFGFSNTTSLLIATSKGLELQIVAPGDSTTGNKDADFGAVVAEPGSGISSPRDLAGKTVAVNTLNNIGTSTIQAVVEADGGDPSTVKFVEVPFPDMPAQLQGGNVDAAWILEPFLTIAQHQGAVPVTYNYAEIDPNLMIAAYFTSDAYAKESPDVVSSFQAAMQRSLQYANAHPVEARAALDLYTKIDPAVRDALVLPAWPGAVDENTLTLLANLAVKYKLLKSAPDTSALLP